MATVAQRLAALEAAVNALKLGKATTGHTHTAAPRFAPPTTSRTVTVPAGIDATGGTDASAALAAFLGNVPDGSVISFPANATYKLGTVLRAWNRRTLVLEGNGSTLVAGPGTDYANGLLSLYNSADIAIRGLSFVGGNPNPGRLVFGSEDKAHAISIHADDGQPSRIEIAGCTSTRTWGDFVQIGGETWPDGVWLHDCDIRDAGRSAWSVLAVRNLWVERNRIGNCGLQHHNIEPWQAAGGAQNVHVLDNTSYGKYGFEVTGTGNFAQWLAMNGTPEASISDVVVARNRVEAQVMAVAVTVGRRKRLTFEDNVSLASGTPLYGASAVIDLRHVDGVTVRRNTQPLASGAVVGLVDCTGVVPA